MSCSGKRLTQIEIEALAERVGEILTDFPAYPRWNPFIRRAIGDIQVGAQLEIYLKPSGASGMTFRPRVLKSERNRELRWLGSLWISGLFDGEHSFLIEPIGVNRVRFVQREMLTGLLVPLFVRGLDTDTRHDFEDMNRALKLRVEHVDA